MFEISRPDPAKALEPMEWRAFCAGLTVVAILIAAGLWAGLHSVG